MYVYFFIAKLMKIHQNPYVIWNEERPALLELMWSKMDLQKFVAVDSLEENWRVMRVILVFSLFMHGRRRTWANKWLKCVQEVTHGFIKEGCTKNGPLRDAVVYCSLKGDNVTNTDLNELKGQKYICDKVIKISNFEKYYTLTLDDMIKGGKKWISRDLKNI